MKRCHIEWKDKEGNLRMLDLVMPDTSDPDDMIVEHVLRHPDFACLVVAEETLSC